MSGLWGRVVGLEQVGVHDNFFASGGCSLTGTRLLARIKAAFNVSISLSDLFKYQNVVGFATHIGGGYGYRRSCA